MLLDGTSAGLPCRRDLADERRSGATGGADAGWPAAPKACSTSACWLSACRDAEPSAGLALRGRATRRDRTSVRRRRTATAG